MIEPGEHLAERIHPVTALVSSVAYTVLMVIAQVAELYMEGVVCEKQILFVVAAGPYSQP